MSQERGVTIDDDTGVVLMESWHHYWVPTMIRNNFCIDDLSQKCHFGRQEGGVTIDDDTGVTLTESPDIQDNISGHSGQLSLKKYRRKTSLNARSPRFSPSGTWASSTTSMGLGSTPTPSSWSSAMTWGLAVGSRSLASIILTQWSSKHGSFKPLQRGRWRKSLEDRTEVPHLEKIFKTNANNLLLYISLEWHWVLPETRTFFI